MDECLGASLNTTRIDTGVSCDLYFVVHENGMLFCVFLLLLYYCLYYVEYWNHASGFLLGKDDRRVQPPYSFIAPLTSLCCCVLLLLLFQPSIFNVHLICICKFVFFNHWSLETHQKMSASVWVSCSHCFYISKQMWVTVFFKVTTEKLHLQFTK